MWSIHNNSLKENPIKKSQIKYCILKMGENIAQSIKSCMNNIYKKNVYNKLVPLNFFSKN